MKKDLILSVSILLLIIALTACSSAPPTPMQVKKQATATALVAPSATPSPTPDACLGDQAEAEVQKVHRHMREFDDAAILASNQPRDQLSSSIENLQRIRREAEDEQVSACLTDLKIYQVNHMNTVINTLVGFIGGADTTAVEQGIAIARGQHDQYTLELARLLGLTIVPATEAASTPSETATP